MKYQLYSNGVLVTEVDSRTVQSWAAKKKKELHNRSQEEILATGLDWMVQRQVSGGTPIPQSVKDACAAIRLKANNLTNEIDSYVAAATSDGDKVACDNIDTVKW